MEFPSSQKIRGEMAQIEQRMADPTMRRQAAELKRLAALYASRRRLADYLERYEKVIQEKSDVAEMQTKGDAEMRQLAEEDMERLNKEEQVLMGAIEEFFLPPDPRDSRDVIIEIRAGAGGEEAALFAAELFRAYSRFIELQGGKIAAVSISLSEQGGFKEVVAEAAGDAIFGLLKYERGVHRVQRVPETEKQGRLHTSTVTVAVLPQAEEIDIAIRPEDLRVDTYRASGKGGQHVNKTSSAVRITHLPTNTVVAVQDERSQHKNREKAMKILRARLLEAKEASQHKETAQERRVQIGTGDRSEKIRTYNFPQDRITDHRIKRSWSNIPEVMGGNFGAMIKDLQEADRAIRLKALKG